MFTNSEAYCSAIIMDDGAWQESPNVYNIPSEDANKIVDQWEANFGETLKTNPGKTGLIARCHS